MMSGTRMGLVAGLLLVLMAAHATTAQEDEAVVATAYGAVRGVVEDEYRYFYGIPHAAPPVGDLRWRAPVAPAAWAPAVRDATLRMPDCIQGDPDRTWFQPTSEDCLYMNVWAPRAVNATPGTLPVFVFFHGGSNTQGGIGIPMYNGRGIVQQTQDVVIVTANYRLNVFGFLAGQALAAESADGAYGNYALLDQRAALHWVRDNIAAFGGDPARVVIAGESAGSLDTQMHLVLPNSAGLFVGAIMESGASDPAAQLYPDEAEANYASFAAALGCSTLACLRAIPAFDLGRRVSLGQFTWRPTADGVELVDGISNLIIAGRFARVPVLLGSNEDEVPALAPRNLTEETYRTIVLATYGAVDGNRLLGVYPAADYPSPWFAFQQLLTDAVFTCGVTRNAKWMSAYTNVYAYYFTHTTGLGQQVAPSLGAFHGTELPFVFNFERMFRIPDDFTVARHFVSYWTNFVRSGDPNVGTQAVPIAWPVYAASGANNVHVLLQPAPALRAALKQEQCEVWDDIVGADAAAPATTSALLAALEALSYES